MKKHTKKQNVAIAISTVLFVAGFALMLYFCKGCFDEAARLADKFDETFDPDVLTAAYRCEYRAYLYFFFFMSVSAVAGWWLDYFLLKDQTIKTRANLILFAVLTVVQAAVCYGFSRLISIDHFVHFGYAYMLVELTIIKFISMLSSVFKKKQEQGVQDK